MDVLFLVYFLSIVVCVIHFLITWNRFYDIDYHDWRDECKVWAAVAMIPAVNSFFAVVGFFVMAIRVLNLQNYFSFKTYESKGKND